MRLILIAWAALAAACTGAVANSRSAANPMLSVQQSDEYGRYLADAQGRPLYMFTEDRRREGAVEAESRCGLFCSRAWPPFTVTQMPELAEGLDASLLDAIEASGDMMHVTYAGWPLYYYAADQGASSVEGQGVHGEWFLVSPDGTIDRAGVSTDVAAAD